MRHTFTYASSDWSGPAVDSPWRGKFRIFSLLKSLIIPPRGQRVLPTITGYVLIIMAIGLGMGAYNAASNILFIALSVLLSSLIVSGVLSWLNFQGICWRMSTEPACRAGEECHVRIEVRNTKRFLPTYALSFIVSAQQARVKTVLHSGQRLDAGEAVQLDFFFAPAKRGRETVRVVGVASQFPFGFLRKTLNGGPPKEVIVWPRRIEYRFQHRGASMAQLNGRTLAKPGSGAEFINLRSYRHGDSQRQIHWKASARLRNLVVQQFAAENHSGFVLFLRSDRKVWADAEQFERLCSLVSSLAEDLFLQERLHGVRIDDSPVQRIVRRGDLDAFQDQLATLERFRGKESLPGSMLGDTMTFEPGAEGEIIAYVEGQQAVTA